MARHREEPKAPMTFKTPDGKDLDFRYTNNWFNQYHREEWEKLFLPIRDNIKHYLEIGVCEGSSMLWVMTS